MDGKVRNVTDIIDIEYLQAIQDSIGRLMGITTVLLDPEGVLISRPTNMFDFCALMQTSPVGQTMCFDTNIELIKINRMTKQAAIRTCPNSGLKTAAVPIFLEDMYLGSWIIGQMRMDQIDPDLIRQTAEKAGISKADAQASIGRLPMITQQEFENVLNFLQVSTKTVTDILEINSSLVQQTKVLESTTQQLDGTLRAFQDFIDHTDIGAFLVDFHTDELLLSNHKYRDYMAKGGRVEALWKWFDKSELLDQSDTPKGHQTKEVFSENGGRWYNIKLHALRWIDGRLAIMATILDITERKDEEQKIKYLAFYDQKLGVANSLKLHRDMAKYSQDDLTIICFDARNLREINNVYSRGVGDLLIGSIATWVSDNLIGPGRRFYRIKGNEFAIMVRNQPESRIDDLAMQVFLRFNEPWMVDVDGIEQRLYTGTRMGIMKVLSVPESFETLVNLMERIFIAADKAEKPIYYDDETNEEFKKDLELQVSLKACILNEMEGFSLNYQPIVNAVTGKWVAMEVLCRWNSPTLGAVGPAVFIEKAEQLGYISAISRYVFREAIRQAKEWKLDLADQFHHISINLSSIHLRDRELLPKLLSLLGTYDFPASKLVLEITETAEVTFDRQTIDLLQSIKDAGISLAIDDFGNGYASFLNLKRLPVDILKTDRSFVDGIEQDEFLQKTMHIIVEYAHAIGLTVTVEGVETEQQRTMIEHKHANMIQGYYFSRPLSAESLTEQIHNFWQ